jgi:hypothetical protein
VSLVDSMMGSIWLWAAARYDALSAKAHQNKHLKPSGAFKTKQPGIHDSTTARHKPTCSIVALRGQIALSDMSGMFSPPLPTECLFLEGGQPLNHKISLRHPYNNDVLFTLLAWDDKDGALHYGLLHTACTVVAENRHDGYLSASRDCHAKRIALDRYDIVPC